MLQTQDILGLNVEGNNVTTNMFRVFLIDQRGIAFRLDWLISHITP